MVAAQPLPDRAPRCTTGRHFTHRNRGGTGRGKHNRQHIVKIFGNF
jgi:hypothetical protein